jgi:hypothetical protein
MGGTMLPGRRHVTLTTDIAHRWMGTKDTDAVVGYIRAGELRANNCACVGDRRARYVIYFEDFVSFLKARNWSRIPATPEELFGIAGRRESDALLEPRAAKLA